MALNLQSLFENIFKEINLEFNRSGLTYQTPENRKANWEKTQTDPLTISLFNFRLEFNFEIPQFRWSFNFNFNFLLSLHLTFQFNLPTPDLKKFTQTPKPLYGVARYGISKYDPPDFTNADLQKAAWYFRYLTTHYKDAYPKTTQEAARKYIEIYKNHLRNAGVSDAIVEGLTPSVFVYEGKVLTAGYVGVSVVGVARVMPKVTGGHFKYTGFLMRSTEDYRTFIPVNSVTVHEPIVGLCVVGYCTVAPSTRKIATHEARSTYRLLPKEVGDYFAESVHRGRNQFAPNVIPTPEGVVKYQPYSIAQMNIETAEKKRFRGGYHQYVQQEIIVRTKKILDREGIVNWFRKAYIDFALEWAYMYYKSSNRKSWKAALSSDEPIIEKYVAQGCDRQILEKIKYAIFQIKETP